MIKFNIKNQNWKKLKKKNKEQFEKKMQMKWHVIS